jgi:hypothetical protein
MKFAVLFLLFFASAPGATAQPSTNRWAGADRIAIHAPEACNADLDSLAAYLRGTGRDEGTRARLVFTWIAHHVDYDVHSFYTYTVVRPDQQAASVFRNRKGVCAGYADLFRELAGRVGLEATVVSGFSDGRRMAPHAWNAVKIDNQWRLLDVTFAAGGITTDRKFVRQFDDAYFLPEPKHFAADHLPLDPMWQLLHQPLTAADFKAGRLPAETAGVPFNYSDTIARHLSLKPFTQELDFTERSFRFHPGDHMVRRMWENARRTAAHNRFEAATAALAKYYAIKAEALRKSPRHLNGQEARVRELLGGAQEDYQSAIRTYEYLASHGTDPTDTDAHNVKAANANLAYVREERSFTGKYYKTPKLMRPFVLLSHPGLVRF